MVSMWYDEALGMDDSSEGHLGMSRGKTEMRCDAWNFRRLGGKGVNPAFYLFDF